MADLNATATPMYPFFLRARAFRLTRIMTRIMIPIMTRINDSDNDSDGVSGWSAVRACVRSPVPHPSFLRAARTGVCGGRRRGARRPG